MRILFLDIASHGSSGLITGSGLLACVTEERVVAHRAIDHRIGDHKLVPLIEEALRGAQWAFGDLTNLACVVGPGGFTSLRVGVSCINALSWTLKIPVTGVHLSDLYAARVGSATSFLWLHSTKRTELFIRGFGSVAQEWPQPVHIRIEDFLRKLSALRSPLSALRYTGELLPEHRTIIEEVGVAALSLRPTVRVLPQFLHHLQYQEQVLQPWYGRGW